MIKKKNYIIIDSRDRDTNRYKDPNQYVIILNNVIKNVYSVKLVYALYPKHGTEFYTNLHVEEFSPNAISNNHHLIESFTQLPMMSYYNEYKSELSDKVGKYFEQPISKLGKLTIRFQAYDGVLMEMGEHLLKFEIEYYIYDGPPELNKQIVTKSNIFALPRDFTKRDVIREYKRVRANITSKEEIHKLKHEFKRLIEKLEDKT